MQLTIDLPPNALSQLKAMADRRKLPFEIWLQELLVSISDEKVPTDTKMLEKAFADNPVLEAEFNRLVFGMALQRVQLAAKETSLDKLTEQEVENEIKAYRRGE